jgi:hypothetical protein
MPEIKTSCGTCEHVEICRWVPKINQFFRDTENHVTDKLERRQNCLEVMAAYMASCCKHYKEINPC